LKIYISQGSVATQLRCDGIYSLLHIFHRMCWWKKNWKSEDMDKSLCLTFWATLYMGYLKILFLNLCQL